MNVGNLFCVSKISDMLDPPECLALWSISGGSQLLSQGCQGTHAMYHFEPGTCGFITELGEIVEVHQIRQKRRLKHGRKRTIE